MLLKLKMTIIRSGRRQYEVARAAGMPETRLSRIILGRIRPTSEERRRIAESLGVRDGEIFDDPALTSDVSPGASGIPAGLVARTHGCRPSASTPEPRPESRSASD